MRRRTVLVVAFIATLAAIILIEIQPIFAAARLIECLLLGALFAVAAWAVTGRLGNIFVTCSSLLVGLAILEGTAMAITTPAGPIGNDSGNGKGRPILGWGPVKPGVFHSTKTAPDGHIIFDTHVTIDANLNRKTISAEGPRPIAFFGDSWIYGDGVEDSETLPQAFADLTGRKIPVLNLAFGGWSPAQNLAALQFDLYKPLLDKPRHFVLFTATFHVERTSCRASFVATAPRYIPDSDGVTYTGACAGAATGIVLPALRVARRFALYQRIQRMFAEPTHADVETYIKIVEAFVRTAKEKYGVQTTVYFAPFKQQYIPKADYKEADIVAKLRADGLDVLVDEVESLPNFKRYLIPIDRHPNGLSNVIRAKQIEAHLKQVDPAALDVTAAAAAAGQP